MNEVMRSQVSIKKSQNLDMFQKKVIFVVVLTQRFLKTFTSMNSNIEKFFQANGTFRPIVSQ